MSDLLDDRDTEGQTDDGEELNAEQLKEQVAKKEQDIQFLKGKWGEEKSELQRSLRELQDRQAQFEGRISEQRDMMSQTKEPEREILPWDDEDFKKDVADEPYKMGPVLDERLDRKLDAKISMLVDILKERDGAFQSELDGLKGFTEKMRKETDPTIQAWKSEIDELRKNEKLANLDDETLIEIAKAKGAKPAMEYRGDAGGQRYRQQSDKARTFDALPDSDKSMFIRMADGNNETAKRIFERYEAKRIAQ
jgi:hypothetical protein